MSVQTPHATFAQQRPDTVAPFFYKSQGLPIHVLVVTKSGTISVRLDQVLNLDRVETNMIVNLQTSPPSGFLNANGTRFQFQLLPSNYCVVHLYMEFDISNTTTAAVQLTPLLFLVDRIRIRNGASNILQEATGDQIYQELCFNYSQNQLINLQSLTNTSDYFWLLRNYSCRSHRDLFYSSVLYVFGPDQILYWLTWISRFDC